MNKTIRRKLILSGITLAIAGFATTATTYAWFTSNSTVSTNEVEGTVADDSSIYVKSDLDSGFGPTATIDASKTIFTPIQTTDGKAFKGKDGTTDAAATDYLTFTLTFTGAVDTPVYMTSAEIANLTKSAFTLKANAYETPANWDKLVAYVNSTESIVDKTITLTLVQQYNTATTETADKVDEDEATKYLETQRGKTITVDVIDALYLAVETQDQTVVNGSHQSSATTTAKVYQNTAAKTDANYDSLTYYNNILTTTPLTRPENYQSTIAGDRTLSEINATDKALLLGYIPSNNDNELVVKFSLYLDGWDQECFDAITSQTFNATFGFASSNSAA